MKADRIAKLQIALLAITCCLSIAHCIYYIYVHMQPLEEEWLSDLLYRYNESVCMHEGIDPFEIFERKITSEKYVGHGRPDKPVEPLNGRKIVHSYPAWHAAVFWWYGYIPKRVCMGIMAGIYLFTLICVCRWTSHKLIARDSQEHVINILFLVITLLYPLCGIFRYLNYGLLLLGCSLLLYLALERGHDMLAGIIYSLIMIKPQIGLLLIFPLLFNRKYKTIALAVVICLIETCFTAYMLNKSPIELILQIPKLGAPYSKGVIAERTMKIVGPAGQYIVMGIFICIAGGGSFLVRNAKEIWIRFLPVIAFIPFWTYSQPHDWLINLTCYIYLLNNKRKYPQLFDFCIIAVLFQTFFAFANLHQWYSIGKDGIAVVLHLSIIFVCYAMVILEEGEKNIIHHLFSKLSSSFGNNNV